MDSEPKTYRISPEGVERLSWKRTLWLFVFIVLFTVLFVFASGQSANQAQRQRRVVGGCIVIVSALIGSLLGGQMFQRRWSSYRLRFGDDNILRLREDLRADAAGSRRDHEGRGSEGNGIVFKDKRKASASIHSGRACRLRGSLRHHQQVANPSGAHLLDASIEDRPAGWTRAFVVRVMADLRPVYERRCGCAERTVVLWIAGPGAFRPSKKPKRN